MHLSADTFQRLLTAVTILQEVMASPVLMSDGFSYERSAITAWLSRSDRSPMTTEPLSKDIMIPNHTLKALIAHATAKV